MTDEHEAERPDYDPHQPDLPSREPPLRSTAPQSAYTMGQVGQGIVIFLVGAAVTFGLPFALA